MNQLQHKKNQHKKHSAFLFLPLYYKELDDRLNHNQHSILQFLSHKESVSSSIQCFTQTEIKQFIRDNSNRFKDYLNYLIAGGYITVMKSFNKFHNYYLINSIPQLFATRFVIGLSLMFSSTTTPSSESLKSLSALLYNIIKENKSNGTTYADYFNDKQNILTDRLNTSVPFSELFPKWEKLTLDFSQPGKTFFPTWENFLPNLGKVENESLACSSQDDRRFLFPPYNNINIKRILFLGDNEILNIKNISTPSTPKSEIFSIQDDRVNILFFRSVLSAKYIIDNHRFDNEVKKPVTDELLSRLFNYLMSMDIKEKAEIVDSYNSTYKEHAKVEDLFNPEAGFLVDVNHSFIKFVVAKYSRNIIKM